jgi:hypothetical protein
VLDAEATARRLPPHPLGVFQGASTSPLRPSSTPRPRRSGRRTSSGSC